MYVKREKEGWFFLKRLIVCVWLGGRVRKEAFPTLCVSDGDKKVENKSHVLDTWKLRPKWLHCLASRLRSAFVLCASSCDAGIDNEVTYCSSLQDVSYRKRVKKPGISHITYQFCKQDLPYKLFFEYLS